jgi:hypothetical protein
MSDQHAALPAEAAGNAEPQSSTIAPEFGSDDSDYSDYGNYDPKVFSFRVPLTPVTLSNSAHDALNKLKTRSSTHINLLCGDWKGFRTGHFVPLADKPNIIRDAGILLQLPGNRAKKAIDMVQDEEAKVDKLKNEHLKALIIKMKAKPKEYVEQVKLAWDYYNTRKHEEYEHMVRYYKDVGLLMQLPDEQVRAVLHILLRMIEEGRITTDKDSDKLTPDPFSWRIVYEKSIREIKKK